MDSMQVMKDERYWIGSDGERPERLYFSASDAFYGCTHRYIDSFASDGEPVNSYCLVNGRYTDDF